MSMRNQAAVRRATMAALVGNSIFGFSFMSSRIALAIALPSVLLMVRFIAAAALLLAVAAWSSRAARMGRHCPAWLRFSLRGRRLAPLLLLGFVQPVLYFLCESYGISMTNATISGVLIALIPIASLALGALLLGERPRRAQVLWSMLSIAGVVMMTMQQSAEGEIRPLGVALLIGAVLTGAAYNIISRGISGEYSVLERTVVMMVMAAVVFTGMAIWQTRGDITLLLAPLAEPAFLLALAYLSVCSSVGAFMLLNYANTELPVAKTTAFCNLTTVISLFAGAVFLGEPFGAVSVIASAMIIAGIWGVQKN
ncbi:MAG: DMT family transporter [Clostridia bacterium]|nr:DMT family transporter [Clostridia bacterium]